MRLKRTTKRKSLLPHTKITNYGNDKTIKKIDKAMALLEKNSSISNFKNRNFFK